MYQKSRRDLTKATIGIIEITLTKKDQYTPGKIAEVQYQCLLNTYKNQMKILELDTEDVTTLQESKGIQQ